MSLLLPDSGLLFWMFVAFGIVFVILAKYGFPIIIRMVEDRKVYIDQSLEVAREANAQLSKLKHIGVGKLITAVPVDKETEDRIRSAAAHILHAQMELETVVDPSIEGGFIFDINDYRLDASIATQLKRVKQQFIDKNRRIV